jgi:S-adenosylmethionine synthetase
MQQYNTVFSSVERKGDFFKPDIIREKIYCERISVFLSQIVDNQKGKITYLNSKKIFLIMETESSIFLTRAKLLSSVNKEVTL